MTRRKTDNKRGIWSFQNLWKHNTKSSLNAKEVLGEKHKRQSHKMWWTEVL